MEQFRTNLREWIKRDDDVIKLQDRIETIQEQIDPIQSVQEELADQILDFVEENKMTDKTVNTGDGMIHFIDKKRTPSVSIRIVELALARHGISAPQIIETIRAIRQSETTGEIIILRKFTADMETDE